MIKSIRKFLKRITYSLRVKTLVVLFLGVVLAAAVYIGARLMIVSYIDSTYITEQAKLKRAESYIKDLQSYVTDNEISSQDTKGITRWIHRNRYVYLLLYKDSELFFEGSYDTAEKDEGGTGTGSTFPSDGGFLVEYPDREELIEYAKKNGLYPLVMTDGLFLASVADFGEYFYYNLASTVSLVIAFIALALVMMSYFHDITKRIANLADDVTSVAGGDMHHAISATGNDELTTLSQNVENMRESMLVNISKEREARAANTELITSMSHDIRTPLTVLLGYIDVMKLEEDPGSMKSYIKAAEQTALRLKDLSDDMFKYFLVSGEGAPAVSIASYDAKTLLEQMLYEHVLLLSEQGYDIAFEMPDIASGSMSIRTDAPYTMRIIDNLFSNIRKYADRSKPITLSAVREGDKLKVSFENSVAKDANEAESSGIGMKTSKRIAELLGLGFACREEGNIFRTEVEFPIEISSNQ